MTEAPLDQRETTRQADLPGAPFGGGARDNPDDWIPLVDLMEIFGGFRYVDDHGFYDLHDAPIGVSLRIEEANKTDPILKAEMEWEKEGKMRPLGIWKKDGQFHLVYNTSGSPLVTCYAVSEDGYNWTRPELGQVEFKGSKKNNIVADGPKGGIFQDPNAPPEERFKAMSQDMFWVDPETAKIVTGDEADKRLEAQKREGRDYKGPTMQLRAHLIGWTSPDGVHWMRINEPLAPLAADSGSPSTILRQAITSITSESMPSLPRSIRASVPVFRRQTLDEGRSAAPGPKTFGSGRLLSWSCSRTHRTIWTYRSMVQNNSAIPDATTSTACWFHFSIRSTITWTPSSPTAVMDFTGTARREEQ